MLKDQMPVAGNSSDTRRPILTVSPGERQKQLKNLKSPKNKELDSLKEEFYLYKLRPVSHSPLLRTVCRHQG